MSSEHAQSLHVIGGIAHRLRLFDLAVEFIRAAIRSGPEHVEFVGNLGNVYQDLGRIDLAVDCFRKVIAAAPKAEMAHNNLANLLQGTCELEDAADSYHRAVEICPEFFAAWSNLGIVLQKLDRTGPAIEAFEQAIRIKPDFVEAQVNLCTAHHEQGATDQALRGLQDIVAQHPDAIIPANKLMEILFERGNLAQAAELAPKIRNLNPSHQMAIACEAFGKLDAGDAEGFEYLYGDQNLIHRQIVPPPEEFTDRAVFHDALQHEILNHPSHLHEGNWLSGTYYVRVPKASRADNLDHAGWITFDGFSHLAEMKQYAEKFFRRVEPQEGLLVLFPSYQFHETTAFHGDDLRIGLSFDFIPA